MSSGDVRAAVARLSHRDVSIVSLSPTRLDDVLGDVERVAAGIGREAEGAAVRASLEERMRAVAGRASLATTRPRVVSLEWIDPIMLGGTWMPELIELAGGLAVGARAGQPARTVDAGELAALRPDVVVVKPCGLSLERALAESDVLERAIDGLGPATRVYVTDGNAYFNRPGPRLVESLEIMAACVHPALVPYLAAAHADVIRRLR